MQFHWFRYVVLSLLATLGGCAVANAVVDPYTKIRIEPSIGINPDPHDRPSPVVVRLYELTSKAAFENSDFFSLYDNAAQALAGDLIASEEFVLLPGKTFKHRMQLKEQTRYIGVIAAFQDIQDAQWRLVTEASPQGYDTIEVLVDKLSLQFINN